VERTELGVRGWKTSPEGKKERKKTWLGFEMGDGKTLLRKKGDRRRGGGLGIGNKKRLPLGHNTLLRGNAREELNLKSKGGEPSENSSGNKKKNKRESPSAEEHNLLRPRIMKEKPSLNTTKKRGKMKEREFVPERCEKGPTGLRRSCKSFLWDPVRGT